MEVAVRRLKNAPFSNRLLGMSDLVPKLQPPATKGHTSVVRLAKAWYVASTSKELKKKPRATRVLGIPMVLYRGKSGSVSAFLDRCPHRNVPLSLGSVQGDELQCSYHGWRFAGDGRCVKVPGHLDDAPNKGKRATSFPCREQDGLIWVWTDLEGDPTSEPYTLDLVGKRGYTTVRHVMDMEGSVHATIENALDVPHTAFLHAGLFRGTGPKNRIEAIVRRRGNSVEAEFLGEPTPKGLMGRILAPRGGTMAHFDRFILPSIAQVEYRLGDRSHVVATSFCTPITDFHTRLYGVANVRLPLPGWLVALFAKPVAMKVLKQDATILRAQSKTIEAFGGEQFESTEIDILGASIWRLLKEAQKGENVDVEGVEEVRRTMLFL
jgi:phenylpropionate dioxygenase-like ring-hydroxylating dioxygenase large terminal subunit